MPTEICVFNPTTSLIDIVTAVSAATGNSQDAGLPIVLNANGDLDGSFVATGTPAYAAVSLAAGDLVNLYYNASGVSGAGVYAQLASAAHTTALPAHGYVTADATAGASIMVYTQGQANVPFTSGFVATDVGQPVFLSNITAGQVVKTKPTAPDLIQSLGYITAVGASVQFTFSATPLSYVGSLILPQTIFSAAGTTLPTASLALKGATAIVSDATSPSYMGAYTSGGTITCQVICSYNGSTYSWLTK